jgi:uncharacterized protein (DUF3820 family)
VADRKIEANRIDGVHFAQRRRDFCRHLPSGARVSPQPQASTDCNLPVSYLEWFAREGFPKGQLGMLLATIYEIKINGLEELLVPIRKKYPPQP